MEFKEVLRRSGGPEDDGEFRVGDPGGVIGAGGDPEWVEKEDGGGNVGIVGGGGGEEKGVVVVEFDGGDGA
ncbi:hypothetical protein F2Q70_00018776 [Brassica cretica]|uniref:Uncharacterized protein n=1 Tax=Brassica cretica TaxID=69181 RepID=A0A8S9HZU8_BRACR|nr:hypothetical protein F2Q70_00018776 [Brassica cretica]